MISKYIVPRIEYLIIMKITLLEVKYIKGGFTYQMSFHTKEEYISISTNCKENNLLNIKELIIISFSFSELLINSRFRSFITYWR